MPSPTRPAEAARGSLTPNARRGFLLIIELGRRLAEIEAAEATEKGQTASAPKPGAEDRKSDA